MKLHTPHIPLGISLDEGIKILKVISSEIEKIEEDEEEFYKVATDTWECGFYVKDSRVCSSWYNDPSGRENQEGINIKVTEYLARYGNIEDWQDGVNNGWIQFFTNDSSGINMAYGIDKDVLRFNKIN